MPLKMSNNATSTLAAPINDTETILSVAGDDAPKFPSLGAGDWFPITVVDSGGDMEIMKVTGRSAAVLTVVRAQEGTTAKTFAIGARVDNRNTAAAIASKADADAMTAALTAMTVALTAKADATATATALAAKRNKAIPYVDVARTSDTVDIGAASSLAVNITGDGIVNSLGTSAPDGSEILVRFDGACTLGGANIGLPSGHGTWVTSAGETFLLKKEGATFWRGLSGPMFAASLAAAEAGANNVAYMTPLRTKQAIVAAQNKVLHVREQRAQGTSAGTAISGIQVRTINTVVVNNIDGASLSGNQITLPAGTYDFFARVPAGSSAHHKAFLRVGGGGATLIEGSSGVLPTGVTGDVFVRGRLTIASPTSVEVAHFTQNGGSSVIGSPTNLSGHAEIYTEVMILKVD